VRRIIMAVVVVIVVSVIVFLLLQLVPGGDPVRAMLGLDASQSQVDAMRHELWLDRSVVLRYGHWLDRLFHGDLGMSVRYRLNVTSLIAQRLPVTLHLAVTAMIIACVLGILGGIVCAVKRNSFIDQAISVLANGAVAVPVFWLGVMGIYLFGLNLHWLPVQGYTSPTENFWLSTKKIIMPVICICLPMLAMLTRQTRSSMLEVVRQDFVRTAWSKGLTQRRIIAGHALKNALIPVITLVGLGVPQLFAGSVLVETVFNIPGMGRLLVGAVIDKDFIVTQACTLIIAIIISVVNFIVDISYGLVDPRIRYQ
ncbi:MAG TPA: ABC transporter permease, partial [Dehalococcoidales bacterium]|nr:ABC transporter permease [Dehalococcoidales bacterium]